MCAARTTTTEENDIVLTEPTTEKLHALRLSIMADAWKHQQGDPGSSQLSFDERFALLVDAEYRARDDRRLKRLLKDAELRIPTACLEDVETSAARGLEKPTVRQLSLCSWIADHHNVLITGPT